jgi:hypothetical protein
MFYLQSNVFYEHFDRIIDHMNTVVINGDSLYYSYSIVFSRYIFIFSFLRCSLTCRACYGDFLESYFLFNIRELKLNSFLFKGIFICVKNSTAGCSRRLKYFILSIFELSLDKIIIYYGEFKKQQL